MNTGYILINEHSVSIFPFNGEVWLTTHQIAKLFEVLTSAVTNNIKSILKFGVLEDIQVHRLHHEENRITDLYNLQMIIALSYRLSSKKAAFFRQWIFDSLCFSDIKTNLYFSSFTLN